MYQVGAARVRGPRCPRSASHAVVLAFQLAHRFDWISRHICFESLRRLSFAENWRCLTWCRSGDTPLVVVALVNVLAARLLLYVLAAAKCQLSFVCVA